MTLHELARYIHPDARVELRLKNGRPCGELIFEGFSDDLPMRYADLKILTIRNEDECLVIGLEESEN